MSASASRSTCRSEWTLCLEQGASHSGPTAAEPKAILLDPDSYVDRESREIRHVLLAHG